MRSPKTQRLWLLMSIIAWLFVAAPLRAQSAAPLTVTRGEGTSDCPDAAGLTARIEEIRKIPAPAAQPSYEVTFARDAQGVYAEIVSAQTDAERVLTDTSADCAALAQATAVTLALLFDADARALEGPPAPAPPPVTAEPLVPAPPPVPAERDPANVHRWIVSYGLGGFTGVVAPIGPGFTFEMQYAYGSWRAALGVLIAPAGPHELGSGHVEQFFVGGPLIGCYAPWRDELWRLDLCSGLFAGEISARAEGFDEVRRSQRAWFAPMAEARFGLLPDRLGVELTAGLLVPTTRHDFAIEGVGVAYRSSPIAMLFALRVGWAIAESRP